MTTSKIDDPLDAWVVTTPEGHLGIFATEQLARDHAARFDDDQITVEQDELRFQPMHEIDDAFPTPALAGERTTTMTDQLTVKVALYELDHVAARFRAAADPSNAITGIGRHALVGIDLPTGTWTDLGRPSTITLTIEGDNTP